MQLVDEGLIELDAPIVSVLPEFRVADSEVTRQVTMRHLLTHTSGIGGDHFPDTGRGDDCLERYVASCADLDQGHPLGATMSYCNTGFVTAGRVVERLTGKVWEDALRERLLEPLGLSRTATLPEEAIRHRAAYGHDVEPGEPPRLADVYTLPRATGPAGVSVTCPPSDLISFARMHLDGGLARDGRRVLSAASIEAMQVPQVDVPDATLGDHWGLGWILYDWSGRRLFGHDGNTIGQSAFLRVVPDAGIAVALMTNGGHTQDLYHELMGHLLQELAGIRIPEPPEPLSEPPPLDAGRYAGVYERVGARWEIVERDGRLVGITTVTGPLAELVSKTTEEYVLHPSGPDTFVVREEGERTWSPMIFYSLPDGSRYLHSGARATPWVGSQR
jgi:CubicO group peptidase (beta-lactamase class C family)